MKIGGLQKCSLIDFPGKISAIVFTIGCNFRCPYCHNPELVDETGAEVLESEIFEFLARRKNLLDAVTITGGEPTMHKDLIPFIRKIKEMGFLVKLDSNGTNPEVIEQVQKEKLVDYIAMDIKAPVDSYEKTTGRPVNSDTIRRSISLLMQGDIPYEFRTTVVKTLLPLDDFQKIGNDIRGAKRYYLQKFVPTKTLNPSFIRKTTYTDEEFEALRTRMNTYVDECLIR